MEKITAPINFIVNSMISNQIPKIENFQLVDNTQDEKIDKK